MSKFILALFFVCVIVALSVEGRRGGRREWREKKMMLNREAQQGNLSGKSSKDNQIGGGRREWRRQKWMKMHKLLQANSTLDQVDENKNQTSDSDQFQTRRQKIRAMKKLRKMRRKHKNQMQNKNNGIRNSNGVKPFNKRRRHNRPQRGNKWGRMQKFFKRMQRKPNCLCLKPEQLQKLKELIEDEGLEDEFPQITTEDDDDNDDDDDSVEGTDDGNDDVDTDDEDDDGRNDDADIDDADNTEDDSYNEISLDEATTAETVILS